ncbi:class I SAM-dependent rRNA methyltransferase [Lujinxingia vulgaris]|uniref:Class I SAM-dependent rRNA methyltransferase n=1 Tax=Lujinxingia vulgaris TaxID=2600176 RepID=A0A5C6X1I9_9DELT|nr:class I SAM-dependent methyltransferase [Lujinxingia vulgaris]TXD34114.1 class I SAM-dependent rRNA methyltransferase [Lujinxingia vulgaris]
MGEKMGKSLTFLVPKEGDEQRTPVGQWVQRAWPQGTGEQVEALFASGEVQVNGATCFKAEQVVGFGARVEVEVGEGEEVYGLPEAEALLWGDGWVVVEKPVGMAGAIDPEDPMDPVLFLADMLGVDREGFTPVWEAPSNAGGPWLLATSASRAEELEAKLWRGEVQQTWVAIVPRPLHATGVWEASGAKVSYAVTMTWEGLAEMQLSVAFERAPERGIYQGVLEALARGGSPALGDVERGGYAVEGGVRLRLGALFGGEDFANSWPSLRSWRPSIPVCPTPQAFKKGVKAAAKVGTLEVSGKSLEFLEAGKHPWVLRDRHTGSIEGMEPGVPVRLVGPKGPSKVYAVVDGTGEIVARYWSDEVEAAEKIDEEVGLRVDEAVARRGALYRDLGRTDVFRVVHGEADGVPGVLVDQMGSVMRVTITGRCGRGLAPAVYEALAAHDRDAMILSVEHMRDVREAEGKLPQAEVVRRSGGYLKPGGSLVVKESGLKYRVEPWEGIDVGFFADQRDNRLEAQRRAGEGQRWLNLFCHTGAFSVALAKVGAATVNVDLSKRYLRWLDENLELNGLDVEGHQNEAMDARDYLRQAVEAGELFDGIIVDPPTAAAGSGAFWSVRRDYQAVLAECFEVLKSGGSMLVCRNDRKRNVELKELVRAAARDAGRRVTDWQEAGPGKDYPRMKGFVEGDSFEGGWVRCD